MRYFKKNFFKFSNGHIHSILRPILKTWTPFYSLELEEFEFLLSSYFNVFIFETSICLRMVEDCKFQYAAIFIKQNVY